MNNTWMIHALELAKKGGSNVFPNPQVGAIIVKDNQIIGQGYHQVYGGPHAEIEAFNCAKEDVFGATMYVTLEPCSHHGKTPPCAQAIIDKGISKVVIATLDPNPLVSGKGVKMLREAGIEVQIGEEKVQADNLNEHFFYYIKNKIPFITMKLATTLDGKYATETKSSKWITGALTRQDVHKERSLHHSILVGVQTIIDDDPSLTVRLENYTKKQPLRIILDTTGRIPLNAKVIQDGHATLVVTASMSKEKEALLKQKHVDVLFIKDAANHIDLKVCLIALGKKGIQSVFVEGGKTIHESFLKAHLVNQVIQYVAPKYVGGTYGLNHVFASSMNEAITLNNVTYEVIEQDIKIKGALTSCLQEL